MSNSKNMKYAGIAGIITLILLIPTIVIYVLADMPVVESITSSHAVLITVINLILYIIFMAGFILLGNKLRNNFLSSMAYLLIGVSTIIHIFLILSFTYYPSFENYIPWTVVIMGLVSVPWGISLLKLKDIFGGIATGAGILNILMVIPIIGPALLIIPGYILEAIILFKASRNDEEPA